MRQGRRSTRPGLQLNSYSNQSLSLIRLSLGFQGLVFRTVAGPWVLVIHKSWKPWPWIGYICGWNNIFCSFTGNWSKSTISIDKFEWIKTSVHDLTSAEEICNDWCTQFRQKTKNNDMKSNTNFRVFLCFSPVGFCSLVWFSNWRSLAPSRSYSATTENHTWLLENKLARK